MSAAKPPARRVRDRYMELVAAFPLRPLRSGAAHQQAKQVLRSLGGEQGSGAEDYKAVLVKLIVDFEQNAEHRIDTTGVSAADVVRHLLAERDMSVNAFARAAGVSQSTLSEMLRGKRQWSRTAILRISGFFRLNPGLFLRQ
jgi:HTH-type transcriptional regulator/antitoxin HigA